MNTVKLSLLHYGEPYDSIFEEYMNREETKERIASGNLCVTQEIEAEENFATDDIVGIVRGVNFHVDGSVDRGAIEVEIEPMNGCEGIFEYSFCVPCGRFVDNKDYILWRIKVCFDEYAKNNVDKV